MSRPSTNFNLAVIMLTDLRRHLISMLVFFCIIASAIAIVVNTHSYRQLMINHEQLVNEKDQLDVEWRHLIIEQSALTEHNLIERKVKDKLNMRRPESEDEVTVRLEQ